MIVDGVRPELRVQSKSSVLLCVIKQSGDIRLSKSHDQRTVPGVLVVGGAVVSKLVVVLAAVAASAVGVAVCDV